jgi:hypothetical protein
VVATAPRAGATIAVPRGAAQPQRRLAAPPPGHTSGSGLPPESHCIGSHTQHRCTRHGVQRSSCGSGRVACHKTNTCGSAAPCHLRLLSGLQGTPSRWYSPPLKTVYPEERPRRRRLGRIRADRWCVPPLEERQGKSVAGRRVLRCPHTFTGVEPLHGQVIGGSGQVAQNCTN